MPFLVDAPLLFLALDWLSNRDVGWFFRRGDTLAIDGELTGVEFHKLVLGLTAAGHG